jgi:hypothetical protein
MAWYLLKPMDNFTFYVQNFSRKTQRVSDHLGDLVVDGMIILK